jgi:hypothetical protein
MKIVFVVYNEVYHPRIMDLLGKASVDYFTRWEQVQGKGHETVAHLGTRSFPGLNSVMMIAFKEQEALDKLIVEIESVNSGITRLDDKVRLFQIPLERVV